MRLRFRTPVRLILGGALALAAGAVGLAQPAVGGPSPWDAPASVAPAPVSGGTMASPGGAGARAPGGASGGGVTASGEVLVVKRLGGPAMWKAIKGPSQVFILGAATPRPHSLQWDTVRMEYALDGAAALYLPPRPSFSPFELMKLAVSRGALQLAGGQTLETALPPPERARFLHVVSLIHGKPQTYDRWKPAIAGLFLIADWRRAAGLSEAKPGSTVMHLAQDAHVPVRFVGDFRLDPYVDTAAKLSMADNIACFDAAMDDIDQEANHGRAMAEAWAKADLKGVGDTYKASLLERCLLRIPSVQALLDRGAAQGVDTIQAALVQPGKSVAVIDLNFLLRPDGVLDRLKAAGVTVTTPD